MPRIDLYVPFEEKDEAKQHGARWDATLKVWYIPHGVDLAAFQRWLPPQPNPNAADDMTIVEALHDAMKWRRAQLRHWQQGDWPWREQEEREKEKIERYKALLFRRYLGEHSEDLPLNSLKIEQAVLGSILINNEAFHCVAGVLEASHFREPFHSKVFEIMTNLIRGGQTANPVTVKRLVPTEDMVGDLTVPQYLAQMAAESIEVAMAVHDLGRIIYDLAVRRVQIETQGSN